MNPASGRTREDLMAELSVLRARLKRSERRVPRTGTSGRTPTRRPGDTRGPGRIDTAERHTVEQLRQPLTGIAGYVEGCLAHLRAGRPRSDDLVDAMEKAASECERAIALVHRFAAFVHGFPGGSLIRLNDLVGRAAEAAAEFARRRDVTIRVEAPTGMPLVVGDRRRIRQVLLNLIHDALLEATAGKTNRGGDVFVRVEATRDGWVEIAVGNTGVGRTTRRGGDRPAPLDTPEPDRLDPGLAVCDAVIRGQGGWLWTAPNPDGGTIVRFVLPEATEAAGCDEFGDEAE